MLVGIDVSRYQGIINWPAVAAAGIRFAYIKATENDWYADPTRDANVSGAEASGIPVGCYHFFRGNRPAATQAAWYLSHHDGMLPPALDVETQDGASKATLAAGVRAWLDIVSNELGVQPLVYTRASFWDPYVGATVDAGLWVAHYGTMVPRIPVGWTSYILHQYSSTGRVSGIAGNCDLNHFNGTEEAFAAWIGKATLEQRVADLERRVTALEN